MSTSEKDVSDQNVNYKVDQNDEAPIYFDEAHKSKKDKFTPLDKETGQPVSPVV